MKLGGNEALKKIFHLHRSRADIVPEFPEATNLDVVLKISELGPRGIIYRQQLQELAGFAHGAEQRLTAKDCGGCASLGSADNWARNKQIELFSHYHGEEAPYEAARRKLFDQLAGTRCARLWHGHLAEKWKTQMAAYKRTELYKYRHQYLAEGYIFCLRHWHSACAGAENVLNELAKNCPPEGIKFSSLCEILSDVQNQREAERQQTTHLSCDQMTEVAKAHPYYDKQASFRNLIDDRIHQYGEKKEQPTEAAWREELARLHRQFSLLARLRSWTRGMAERAGNIFNRPASAQFNPKGAAAKKEPPLIDFKRAVLNPAGDGTYTGLCNAIDQGCLAELISNLDNPPTCMFNLSKLCNGFRVEDLLQPLNDGVPILAHHFDKITSILDALQQSGRALSPEHWQKEYQVNGKTKRIIDCAEGCSKEVATGIFDPKNFIDWKLEEIGKLWLDAPEAIKNHITPKHLEAIGVAVQEMAQAMSNASAQRWSDLVTRNDFHKSQGRTTP